MNIHRDKSSLAWRKVLTFAFCAFVLSGCGSSGNYLSQEGFISPNAPVLMYDAQMGLREEQDFLVMNLTPLQAKALLKKFKAQKQADFQKLTLQQMSMSAPMTPNVLWKPKTVKKYWSGSFGRDTGAYYYDCQYVFDISKPGTIVLYFYAYSPFYD